MKIMAQRAQFVGIDVSKLVLDVHCLPERESWQVANTEAEIAELVSRLVALGGIASVLIEASGGYEIALLNALSAASLPARRIDPRRVKKYKESRGKRAKTDRIDARMLAEMARSLAHDDDQLPTHQVDPEREELCALVDWRRQLVDTRVALQSQQASHRKTAASATLRQQANELTTLLRRREDELERMIEQLLKRVPRFAQTARILRSAPGIGLIAAATLIAHLPELGTLDRRAIALLVGVAPIDQKSGKWVGHARIQGGRENVRNVLFVLMMGPTKNARLAEYRQRLLAKGKLKKVAIIGAVHKLLTILNAMLRKGETWRDRSAAR